MNTIKTFIDLWPQLFTLLLAIIVWASTPLELAFAMLLVTHYTDMLRSSLASRWSQIKDVAVIVMVAILMSWILKWSMASVALLFCAFIVMRRVVVTR